MKGRQDNKGAEKGFIIYKGIKLVQETYFPSLYVPNIQYISRPIGQGVR
jgi:hypothetical protein